MRGKIAAAVVLCADLLGVRCTPAPVEGDFPPAGLAPVKLNWFC